jgi:hypothetical protein
LYAPDSFVIAVDITPVAVFVTLIATPGKTACVESSAVPLTVAFVA